MPMNYDGKAYNKGEITLDKYLAIFGDTLDNRLVWKNSATAGAGNNLDSWEKYRLDYNDNLSGDYMVKLQSELGYTIPWISNYLPTQLYGFYEAGSVPEWGQKPFVKGNFDYSYGAGMGIKVPILNRVKIFYDAKHGQWRWSIGIWSSD